MSEPIEYGRPWWEVMKEVSEENASLKAEVERLRKAGDAMYIDLECFNRYEFGKHPDYQEERPTMKAWNAAKEGKPSV